MDRQNLGVNTKYIYKLLHLNLWRKILEVFFYETHLGIGSPRGEVDSFVF